MGERTQEAEQVWTGCEAAVPSGLELKREAEALSGSGRPEHPRAVEAIGEGEIIQRQEGSRGV